MRTPEEIQTEIDALERKRTHLIELQANSGRDRIAHYQRKIVTASALIATLTWVLQQGNMSPTTCVDLIF